jgi:hypothetical protein
VEVTKISVTEIHMRALLQGSSVENLLERIMGPIGSSLVLALESSGAARHASNPPLDSPSRRPVHNVRSCGAACTKSVCLAACTESVCLAACTESVCLAACTESVCLARVRATLINECGYTYMYMQVVWHLRVIFIMYSHANLYNAHVHAHLSSSVCMRHMHD